MAGGGEGGSEEKQKAGRERFFGEHSVNKHGMPPAPQTKATKQAFRTEARAAGRVKSPGWEQEHGVPAWPLSGLQVWAISHGCVELAHCCSHLHFPHDT